MKVADTTDRTHNPFGETCWASCLRENLTSSSYGEGLETGRNCRAPRQSLTRQVFHKALKSNAGLAKSPTQTVTTQSNHVFMSIVAVFKLECLKMQHHLNHFALRAKLLMTATQQAYEQLLALRSA